MLQFVTGAAGTGKTTYITQAAARLAQSETQPLLLLVPEQASFDYEKRMLRALGPRDAQNVEVCSFSRLAETTLGFCSLPPIDDAGRAVLMSIALDSLSEKLEVYARYVKSLSVANELLRLSSEFKRCMLPPSAVQTIAAGMPDCFLKHKLSEIGLILETYDALVAESYTDETDALTRLADHLAENAVFRGRTVMLDAFSGFTAQEYAVIGRLLTQADTVYVALCTDSLHAEKKYDATAFAYVRRTAERILHMARRYDVPVKAPIAVSDKPYRFRSPALCALERVAAGTASTVYDAPAPEITIAYAADVYEECTYVAASVKRLLREEGIVALQILLL